MEPEATRTEELRRLIDEYRDRCLWFLRRDYYPQEPGEIFRTLETIERYGDTTAYRRVAELRKWLSHRSSARSVAS